jgi:hypothetical protein
VATFPAQALGFVGGLAEKLPDVRPYLGVAPGTSEPATRRQELLDVIAKAGGSKGISQYLPKPETTAGEFARTASEFIPSAVAGAKATQFSVPRAAGVGATAGLASEAAGQATEGTAAEPYARLGAALVSGAGAARLAEGAAAKSGVKQVTQAIEDQANKSYDNFRDAGFGINPSETTKFTAQARNDLHSSGRTDVTAPDTWKALDSLEKKPFTNATDFQAAYQTLGNVAKDATKSSDRMAAKMAQDQLLGVLENMKPSSIVTQVATGADPRVAVAEFRNANADWAALKRAENLNQRVAAGELRAGSNYSGLNLENELRRRIGTLAEARTRGGFSPEEKDAFESFAKGNLLSNTRRYARNFLGGGGGLGALATGTAGAGAGAYLGIDPATYGGGAILGGLALAKGANLGALRRARELELMLLSRSPTAAAAGIPGTRFGASRALAPATLATIGENYDEGP